MQWFEKSVDAYAVIFNQIIEFLRRISPIKSEIKEIAFRWKKIILDIFELAQQSVQTTADRPENIFAVNSLGQFIEYFHQISIGHFCWIFWPDILFEFNPLKFLVI